MGGWCEQELWIRLRDWDAVFLSVPCTFPNPNANLSVIVILPTLEQLLRTLRSACYLIPSEKCVIFFVVCISSEVCKFHESFGNNFWNGVRDCYVGSIEIECKAGIMSTISRESFFRQYLNASVCTWEDVIFVSKNLGMLRPTLSRKTGIK